MSTVCWSLWILNDSMMMYVGAEDGESGGEKESVEESTVSWSLWI